MLDDLQYPERDPNKKTAQEIWEDRYKEDSYLFGKEPILSLRNYVSVLKKGKALDIAMGEGRNAIFLAKNGFEVEGMDCSRKAIAKAERLAKEAGVNVGAKVQNLDFFLMPLMRFDTILMSYFRPLPRFFSEIRRGLVHNGTFLMEAYLVDHLKHQGNNNPLIDFEDCYKPNEILAQLREFRILFYKEIAEGNNHTVQVIAQKHQK